MFTNNTNKIRSRIKNIKNIKIDAMCKKSAMVKKMWKIARRQIELEKSV